MTAPQRTLMAAALAALSAALATPAHAINATTPASTCRPYALEDAAALAAHRITPNYTYNADPVNPRRVICPVIRNADADGVTVWIRGAVVGNARINCTVVSYQFNGTLLLAVNRFGAPPFSFPFTALQAPPFGHLNAVCTLPPANQGRLFQLHTVD